MVAGFISFASVAATPEWQGTISNESPGSFAPLRPLHASYFFGWSGFTAATAEVQFSGMMADQSRIEGSGHTTGLVRALWPYDVNYRSVANSRTLRPIESIENDTFR